MKRYCLISFCNIYVLPYAKLYIDAIIASGAECELIYWDRDAVNGTKDGFNECRKICYQRKLTQESSSAEKLLGYVESRNFIVKNLKANDYDGIVFLQTHAAVACKGILKKKYQGKYIVDVRDFTLENYSIYKKLEDKVITNSFATVISSPAYSKFLPNRDFVVAHNYSPFPGEMVSEIRRTVSERQNDPIQISFVGTVRFIDMDMKLLKLFANDKRFKLNYFGTGSEVLSDFCAKAGITNTEFHGSFTPEMTASFYQKTDLINNLYGNHNPFLDYALSNKLYHSGQLYIPILVCPGTYMEEVTAKYNMGFVFDIDQPKMKDTLYNWYHSLDRERLAKGCDEFITSVIEENADFNRMLENFLMQ